MSSRWARQKELFEAAAGLPQEQRESYLEQACEDPSLRESVRLLLVEHDDGQDPIASTVIESAKEIAGDPDSIGRYRLERRLGEGGMGVVYEARQESPERLVALKVVRGGSFVDEETVRMFQREARSLGRLKHPNIAAIHEAGRTDDGRHFFAMELVRGDSLNDFIRRTAPSDEQKLRIFNKICSAIHYAHQRGVIHRDLKPANILVDANGEPKILDFGLARITDADIAMTTMATTAGKIQGTLAYMSPEQARGNPDEIDARSDVYSLGVILFETMTGRLPYNLGKSSLPEALRIICDETPVQAGTIQRTLRGDIDTIARKALEKQTSHRYQSAHELAEDVRRHLEDQPILARPPSTIYQLKKLVARHKSAVVALTTVFAVAVVASIVSTGLFFRAESARVEAATERDRANLESQSARRVTDYLIGMFGLADPSAAPGETVSAEDILNRGIQQIDELEQDPRIQARLLTAMGEAQYGLGLYEQSSEVLTRALGARRELLGSEDPETVETEVALASTLRRLGEADKACSLLEHSVEARTKAFGAETAPTLKARNMLAACLGQLDRYTEALDLQTEVYETQRRVLGDDHPQTQESMATMASLNGAMGDYAAAEGFVRQLLEIHLRELGPDHPDTLEDLSSLAGYVERQGRIEEAIDLYKEAEAAQIRVLGAEHLEAIFTGANLTALLIDEGRIDEAEPKIMALHAYFTDRFGADHGITTLTEFHVGRVHLARSRWKSAERCFRKALVDPGTDPLRIREFRTQLGIALAGQRRFQEAESILLESHDTVQNLDRGLDAERTQREIEAALVDLYNAWGRPEEARRWAP